MTIRVQGLDCGICGSAFPAEAFAEWCQNLCKAEHAQRIAARSDETVQPAQPIGKSLTRKGCAQGIPHE